MKAPVWDLPIRLFHWLLTGLIGFSWWSVKTDHIDWHILSGIAILTLLGDGATSHRRILQEYSPYLLDQMIGVVTASTLRAKTRIARWESL